MRVRVFFDPLSHHGARASVIQRPSPAGGGGRACSVASADGRKSARLLSCDIVVRSTKNPRSRTPRTASQHVPVEGGWAASAIQSWRGVASAWNARMRVGGLPPARSMSCEISERWTTAGWRTFTATPWIDPSYFASLRQKVTSIKSLENVTAPPAGPQQPRLRRTSGRWGAEKRKDDLRGTGVTDKSLRMGETTGRTPWASPPATTVKLALPSFIWLCPRAPGWPSKATRRTRRRA